MITAMQDVMIGIYRNRLIKIEFNDLLVGYDYTIDLDWSSGPFLSKMDAWIDAEELIDFWLDGTPSRIMHLAEYVGDRTLQGIN